MVNVQEKFVQVRLRDLHAVVVEEGLELEYIYLAVVVCIEHLEDIIIALPEFELAVEYLVYLVLNRLEPLLLRPLRLVILGNHLILVLHLAVLRLLVRSVLITVPVGLLVMEVVPELRLIALEVDGESKSLVVELELLIE